MLKQLEKIFSSFQKYNVSGQLHNENYQWFTTIDNEIIGIDKAELTKKDTAILSAFLTPYNIKFPVPTTEEKLWTNRINGSTSQAGVVPPYRFVYFTIKKNQINLTSFKEAIHAFFARPVPILWKNEQEGIIIEEQSAFADEDISYEQIIDVLMSDLYVKINFFVGPYLDSLINVHQHYSSILDNAETVFSYSDQSVVTYIDAIPSLFVSQADPAFRKEITTVVLHEFAKDDELLNTIKTFMHCNLNVSVTAKELYMHRNSLQYRLDKFIEKTGIDVRQFHQAMTVYLALLANMHKDE